MCSSSSSCKTKCKSCTCEEEVLTCVSCSMNVENKEYEFEGDVYCKGCYEDDIKECDECCKEFFEDDMEYRNGNYYCEGCAEDLFVDCYECGYTEYRDDMYCDSGEYYCENCWDDRDCCGNFTSFPPKRLSFKGNTFDSIKSKRCYGLELEVDNDELPYYDIKSNTVWGCKSDCSLDAGGEFYSPILQGDKGYEQIEKICKHFNGAWCGDTAGFHMHIDSRKLSYRSMKRVWLLFTMIENRLLRIVDENRRDGEYCGCSRMDIESIKKIKNSLDLSNLWKSEKNRYGDRYHVTNFESYFYQKTVEIRLHHGTTSLYEVSNWVRLMLSLFDFAVNGSIKKIEALFKEDTTNRCSWANYEGFIKPFKGIVKDTRTFAYLEERYKKFTKI